jgi:hypothetical protein
MVCVHQTYSGEDSAATRILCKFGNVPDAILIGDGSSVQCTYRRYRFSSKRLLEKKGFLTDEVEGRNPRAIKTPSGAVSGISSDTDFAFRGQSGVSGHRCDVTDGPVVVGM